MPKSRHRKHTKRARRPTYQQKPVVIVERLHSPLGHEVWAAISADDALIHVGLSYDQARELAQQHNGIVVSDAAANRIHGFNELAAADSRG